jgi:ankyrin repeat protein
MRLATILCGLLILVTSSVPASPSSIDSKGRTPLMIAARAGRVGRVRTLLKQHVALNAQDHEGKTAMHYAISWNGKPHGDQVAALTYASAEALVKAGAAVNVKDMNGNTPLIAAVILGATNLTKLLLRYGAKVNDVDSVGDTALMQAVYFKAPEPLIKTLLDAGAYVNGQSYVTRATALQTAVEYQSDPATILLLLDAGADPTILDSQGNSALSFAKGKHKTDIVALLGKAHTVQSARDELALDAKKLPTTGPDWIMEFTTKVDAAWAKSSETNLKGGDKLVLYFHHGKMRSDQNDTISLIQSASKTISINKLSHTYSYDIDHAQELINKSAQVQNLGKCAPILGHKCIRYVVKTKEADGSSIKTTVDMASDFPSEITKLVAMQMHTPRSSILHGVPLSITIESGNGEFPPFTIVATRISRTRLPDAAFLVPKSYTKSTETPSQ